MGNLGMLKKKTIIGLSTLGAACLVALTIGTGYIANKFSNRYNDYRAIPYSASQTDLIQTYFASTVKGSKLLYLASFTHTSPLTAALDIKSEYNFAMYNNFGKTGYLLIDDQYGFPVFSYNEGEEGKITSLTQPFWSTNVASVQFRSDLGSFITGIAAAQFLNDYQDYFLGNDNQLKWATYGAMPYSSVISFMGGFKKGIEWFNTNVVPKNPNYKELKEHYKDSTVIAGSFDIGAANPLINDFLDNDVDLIFPVGGVQISDAVKLVRQRQKRTVVIGVDTSAEKNTSLNLDLYDAPSNETIGYENKIIQFSSVKNVDVIVNKVTQAINDPTILTTNANNPEWNNIDGIGYSSLGDVNNGGVGVSEEGQKYFQKALQTFSGDETLTYNQSIKLLMQQQGFIDLDIPSNKNYYNYSYDSIANSGAKMIPINGTIEEISSWYDQTYANDSNAMANKSSNMQYISDWINLNVNAIKDRIDTKTNLVGQFTKEAYQKNKGIIKIIFQDPLSVLFDKSFLELCYSGLNSYWKTQLVDLPDPPGTSK